MKERPIIFNAPMVRAILDGRKTQTRRIVKQVPRWQHCGLDIMEWGLSACYTEKDGRHWLDIQTDVDDNSHEEIFCPYGQPGDRLWVRETWAENLVLPLEDRPGGNWIYRADDKYTSTWRPSIHMPRWASRITLEIASIRVERLQEMRRDDAFREGVEHVNPYNVTPGLLPGMPACFKNYQKKDGWFTGDPVSSFMSLWESINGSGSWNANPWVWVIEFREIGEIHGRLKECSAASAFKGVTPCRN